MHDQELRNVKGLMLLTLMMLTGCASLTSLEQLESEAMVSGDWSKVDRRERSIEMRNLHRFVQQCPDGTASYCKTGVGSKRCDCVKTGTSQKFFSQR
jgi:hypothetical protein